VKTDADDSEFLNRHSAQDGMGEEKVVAEVPLETHFGAYLPI
jgi:hypothetical protein